MSCKICGHPSHCGGPRYARDLVIKIEGISDLTRICEECSCDLCEMKIMSVEQYIEQYKKHEKNRTSTNERNAFYKRVIKIKGLR